MKFYVPILIKREKMPEDILARCNSSRAVTLIALKRKAIEECTILDFHQAEVDSESEWLFEVEEEGYDLAMTLVLSTIYDFPVREYVI